MVGTNFFVEWTNPDGNTEYVALTDENGDVLLSRGLTKPTDTKSGYAPGAIFIDTDAAATAVMYLNEGSNTSCDFNVINPAATSATAYDDIGDPDASGSITMAGYTGTYTSSTANWGGMIFSNTNANPTSGATLLTLGYTADGDAQGIFMDCKDNSSADSKFTIGADGATTIAGSATGTAALTVTAGDITMTSGDIDIAADNRRISFGAAGDTDSYIMFDGTDLQFYDSNVGVETSLSSLIAGTPGGDFTIADGQISWTDTTDEVAGTFTFAGTTNNDINWSSSVTTGKALAITANDITTGAAIYVESSAAGLTSGKYITCYDGAANDFTVGANGAVVIAGTSATDVLTVTAGDVQVTAGDITLSDGSVTLTDADNAASLSVTNNTITTANQLVSVASTSITTGALATLNANTGDHDGEVLEIIGAGDATSTETGISVTMDNPTTGAAHGIDISMAGATTGARGIRVTMDAITESDMLYLDNGGATMTTGYFINCNDDDATLFGVGANGATTIAGAAGSNVLSVTAGDAVLSDGSLTITDADNAATLSVTNATVTTGNLAVLTADAITEGAILYLDNGGASMTTGNYIDCNDDGASVFTVGASGATTTGTLSYKDLTEVVTAANVITASETGSVFFLNSATEFASTLPAPAAGLHFTFIVTAAPSGANYTITTDSSANIIIGQVHESSGGDGDSETSGADTINFVDGASVVGDTVEVWCDGTNWFAQCLCDAAGGITITTAS